VKLKTLLKKWIILKIVVILITINFTTIPLNGNSVSTTSRDSIQDAISSGIAWLASQQEKDGSWGSSYYPVALTGFVVTKLQEYAYEIGYSPFENDYVYHNNVINGWKYLFSTGTNAKPIYINKQALSLQKHGTIENNPDTNSNGYGLDFGSSYQTGICLMALEASGTPNRRNDGGIDFNGDSVPDTFFEIAQDVVDWIAFAQGDSGTGEGGWSYSYINNTSTYGDNSNSGYIVLGLAAGEEFGCTIPDWVRERLDVWINNVQDPVNGDSNGYDGGSYYRPGSSSSNLLRTGNLIFEMTFYGDSPTTPRFEAAIDYIERHWHDSVYTYQGWDYDQKVARYQTMFCLMKGLEYSRIDYLDLDNDSHPEHDWYNEFASVLVAQQEINGSWPNCYYSSYDKILSTTWALLVLEKVVPPDQRIERPIPPIPDAGGPYVGNEGSTIVFDGSGSKDLNDDVLEYRWDFNGDGLWDTLWSLEPNATYTFGDDWFGMALLNVREINTTENYTVLDRAFVTVKNVAPIIYHSSQNFTINENKSFSLFANVNDPGSDDLSVEWQWGIDYIGNNFSKYLNSPPSPDLYPSFEINPIDVNDSMTCNLRENGVYRVTVIVIDDDGAVNIKNIFITVDIPPPDIIIIEPPVENKPQNQPPQALVKGNPISGEAKLPVNLNGFGFDIDGFIVAYYWDFGDGQTYSSLVYLQNNTLDSNCVHQYEEKGIYRVEFSVVDDSGASDNDTLIIHVQERPMEDESIFTLSGYVYKASTTQRIAEVHISTLNISIMTDYSGFYTIEVPRGIYTINVSKIGYESASTTVSVSSDTDLDFYLRPMDRSPKEADKYIDNFWNWIWILVIIVIICLFVIAVTKRKKPSKNVQNQESIKDKSVSNPIQSSNKVITPTSINKQPSLAGPPSAKPMLPHPTTTTATNQIIAASTTTVNPSNPQRPQPTLEPKPTIARTHNSK
jgi:hypothetical protein